ncbi:uncharacterized protein L201_004142 [Kwoniella dendrophila CBS 6074]|uniref:Mediator of RNA polymerase II transcription subunit 6 n=1 Tax=Kwoniella dendrophila CBS 6074 TaxID=1295534 RepID=A0AAX4JWF8_9TREE
MTNPGEEIDQDLSHIHWSWPEAIAANPARSLATADLAMDYFAYSPFWDTKSNNNVLRTQRRVENPTYGHAEEKIELNAFKSGFEYIISHSQPPDLFVVQKREVDPSGKRDRVTGSWFILQERIYQSPTVYDVVSARLRNASHLISKTLNSLSENHPSSNPRTTTIWGSLPPEAEVEPKPKDDDKINEGINEDELEEGPNKDKKEDQKPAQSFDWHLYHSLQSTRSALSSINELSKTPIQNSSNSSVNELREIESQLNNQFGFVPQQQQNNNRPGISVNAALGSGSGSIRSNSIKGGFTPNLPISGMSPSTSSLMGNLGLTPNLGNVNTASPRNVNIMGLSPASLPGIGIGRSGSTVGANSPANLLQ